MREFGRAPRCICNVLAILGEGEESIQATFRAAVDLAEAGNARLTLVKTCEPGRAYVWIAPFAVGAAYMPPELESPDDAARLLARVAEGVPDPIPVTTLVLPADTQASLLRLLNERHFGAIVADADLFSRWWRLRRQLRREELETVLVNGAPNAVGSGAGLRRFSSGGSLSRLADRLLVSRLARRERFATPR